MKWFGDLDWSNWLRGLLTGGITGGAAAVAGAFGAGSIDSNFAFGTSKSWKLMGMMFAMSFLKDVALYLRQNPLPEHLKTVTTTVQTTAPMKPEGKVVTTVEETHTEELPKI